MKTNRFLALAAGCVMAAGLSSCNDDEGNVTPEPEVPATYVFTRNGASSVSFSGQTDRLNMLSEMVSVMKSADAGNEISGDQLLDMYENSNDPFTDGNLNASTKQLKSKTFAPDVSFFEDLMADMGRSSSIDATAEEGSAGLLDRNGNGKTILVNEKGWEYTQLIEKGLMGAVFYNQIFNVYLTDARIGADVDNETIEAGDNYTAKEHHWDEAFGYFGVPVDFPSGDPVLTAEEDRFWAKYTIDLDAPELIPGINSRLMNAYLTGRAAIVANRQDIVETQRAIIYEAHELVTAATAVHYINATLSDLSNGNDIPNAFHHLSEAYAFVKAIQYSPFKKLTDAQINTILNTDFGADANFWEVTPAGLNAAKATIAGAYPEIASIKDIL